MKKVLALVLAVMMMATVAFAAGSMEGDGTVQNPGAGSDTAGFNVKPGATLKITAKGISEVPGSPYKFADSGYVPNTSDKLLKDINSTNYTIKSIKYNDGKNMVTGVEFNDKKDQVEIKLAKDFDLTKVKKLDMTFTLKGKKAGKTDAPDDIDIHIVEDINFGTRTINITSKNETDFDSIGDIWNADAPNNDDKYVYEVKKAADGTSWGTLEFETSDDEVEVEVRVYDGDRFYLFNNMDADNDTLKKYADTGAELTFLNFPGTPTFNSTAKVYFYKEEGTYIYALKDGQLSPITSANAGAAGQSAGNVKWDDEVGGYVLNTRTLGSYVFSDKKLNVATTSTGTNNPDTGANDVVGIATALAAVALVSAAAVSLKK